MHKDHPLIHHISCPVTNTGPVHFIGIEVLGVPDPRERWSMRHLSYDLILQSDIARTYRLFLRPGEKTGMHAFNFCGLLVFLTDGDLLVSERHPPPKRKRRPAELEAGEERPGGAKRPCPAGPPAFPAAPAAAEAAKDSEAAAPTTAAPESEPSCGEGPWQEDLDEWLRMPNDHAEEEMARFARSVYPPPPQAGRIVDVQVAAVASPPCAAASGARARRDARPPPLLMSLL